MCRGGAVVEKRVAVGADGTGGKGPKLPATRRRRPDARLRRSAAPPGGRRPQRPWRRPPSSRRRFPPAPVRAARCRPDPAARPCRPPQSARTSRRATLLCHRRRHPRRIFVGRTHTVSRAAGNNNISVLARAACVCVRATTTTRPRDYARSFGRRNRKFRLVRVGKKKKNNAFRFAAG